jgi:hypothetical protein
MLARPFLAFLCTVALGIGIGIVLVVTSSPEQGVATASGPPDPNVAMVVAQERHAQRFELIQHRHNVEVWIRTVRHDEAVAIWDAEVERQRAEAAEAERQRVEARQRAEAEAEAAAERQRRRAEEAAPRPVAEVEQTPPPVEVEPAPQPQPHYSGGGSGDPNDMASWDRLAQCEAGGNWSINTGNGYYGGLQFSLSSWRGVGGTGYPHEHSRAEQIRRGQLLWQQGGWQHWPACTRSFGWR